MVSIAKAVITRRLALGLTQTGAADLAGFSEATWRSIERDKTQMARLTKAGVARALRWPSEFDRSPRHASIQHAACDSAENCPQTVPIHTRSDGVTSR